MKLNLSSASKWYKKTYRNWIKSHKDIIQTHGAVFSVIAGVIALIFSFISYSESQTIKQENSLRDSITEQISINQFLKRNYFDSIQNALLSSYAQSSDSMLKQLTVQARIAKEQYKAQLTLNRPNISAFRFTGHDSLNYKSFLWKKSLKWRIPEITYIIKNFGVRTATNLSIHFTTYLPQSELIFDMPTNNMQIPINNNEIKTIISTPFVPLIDRKTFYQRLIIGWTDKASNTTKGDTLYYKCSLGRDDVYFVVYMIDRDIENLKKFEKRYEIFYPDKYYSICSKEVYGS